MNNLEKVFQVRRDGKIIDESMSLTDMISRGWSPDKIREVRWSFNGVDYTVASETAIVAKILSNREYVAVIEGNETFEEYSSLFFVRCDGTRRYSLSSTQKIGALDQVGIFSWFEPPRNKSVDCIGVVFRVPSTNLSYHLDVDVKLERIVGEYLLQK